MRKTKPTIVLVTYNLHKELSVPHYLIHVANHQSTRFEVQKDERQTLAVSVVSTHFNNLYLYSYYIS